MSITKKYFGTTADGREVSVFTITAQNGMQAELLDYGATIRTLVVPDKNGEPVDVVLGYDTIQEYETNDGYLGATIGRVGNRIREGKFTLDGKEYTLAVNNGPNHLHGGVKGFDKYVWDTEILGDKVKFSLVSPDGDEGYPGTLNVSVTMGFEGNGFAIEYEATTDKDTVINLTNHSYFNLNGKGDNTTHLLTLNADSFTINDENCLPTGEIVSVEGTAMDFRTEHTIGERNDSDEPCVALSGGYDANYVLNSTNAARVRTEESGIVMTVTTTEPGVQLYSANFTTKRAGKGGSVMDRRYAICLETQHFPDSINHPEWPSTVLKVGDTYKSKTTYSFSANK